MKIDANKMNASLQVLRDELIKIESITGLQLNDLKKELQEKIDGYSKVINSEKSNVQMTDKKHPHHDLIVKWAKDTSKKYQFLGHGNSTWESCNKDGPLWDVETKYREKPRDFVVGHWYPCIDEDGDGSVRVFDGECFCLFLGSTNTGQGFEEFSFVGESLGEIRFWSDTDKAKKENFCRGEDCYSSSDDDRGCEFNYTDDESKSGKGPIYPKWDGSPSHADCKNFLFPYFK